MSAIQLSKWGPLMDAGADTFAVDPVGGAMQVFTNAHEAIAAADQADGMFAHWAGHTGHQRVTTDVAGEWEPEAGA